MYSPNLSIYNSAKDSTSQAVISFNDILEDIRSGVYKDTILKLRAESDKKIRSELKKGLKAVTFSGEFEKRNAEGLKYYSGIICIDIDDLTDVEGKKQFLIETDPYLYAAFISPSGNGLKLLYNTLSTYHDHKRLFDSLSNYLRMFGLNADPSGKDICRLCFVSYDENLYFNPKSMIIDTDFINNYETKELPKENKAEKKEFSYNELSDIIHKTVSKTVVPMDGSYNSYINNFAIQALRFGFSEEETAWAICHHCGWSEPDKEDRAVIKSVYSKFSTEFGKYLTTTKPTKQNKSDKAPLPEEKIYNDSVKFWYKVEKFDKSTGEIKEGAEEYRFSYDDAIIFLENNGFFKLKSGESFHFIHVDLKKKIVSLTPTLRIKEFFIDYLKSDKSLEFKKVREMFRRGAKNYCSTNLLEGLAYYNPEFKRDTEDSAFIYFKNTWLEITKDGIKKHPYVSQMGYVWDRQILDIDYKEIDYSESDVNRFILYASVGRRCTLADCTDEERQKYNSMRSTLGYLLHSYKSPIVTKAIISVDKKLRQGSEDNGGSGKSLFIQLVSKMVKTCRIDAKNFKFDSAFPFQKVDIDTRVIDFDDVRPNFDFTRLFSMITSEFSYEKKGLPLITIPFEDSPKFYISTNKSIKSEGVSTTRRQHVIEFSSFFNEQNTVATVFNRMFFFNWDQEEWQKYYAFMIDCLQLYLKEGLISFPLENYHLNKLIDTAGEEFIDYMDEIVKGQIVYNNEFDSTKLFDTYVEKVKPKYGLKKNTFSKWVKMWADINDLLINAHKEDGRDRRNGVDYWIFTEKYPKNETPPFETELNINPENDIF